jgi:hypothetical protein
MSDAPGNRPHASQTCAFCQIIHGEETASIVLTLFLITPVLVWVSRCKEDGAGPRLSLRPLSRG